MNRKLLLAPEELHGLIQTGNALVVDCRFDLSDATRGRTDCLESHIPGALYADLDQDLASPVTPQTGRHPLPSAEDFARFLASIGWTEEKHLVAYDGANAMIAGRLWWLMRYFGQTASLLDGGFAAWKAAGLPLESGEVRPDPTETPVLIPDASMIVSAKEVAENLRSNTFQVVDARAPDRFRGENETLDTAGGHIPGALNHPFALNLQADARFRSAEDLAQQFNRVLDGKAATELVHSCGSGVSACHNILAMEVAGLGGARLYPGSWSEWIRDPDHPIETG